MTNAPGVRIGSAVVLALLASCGDDAPAAPAAAKPKPLPAHTVWTGRYACAQGTTALTLSIDREPNGASRARFDFGATAENPTVPFGTYEMTGRLVETDAGALTVTLTPYAWVRQPPDYVMVGIDATIDAAHERLEGTISGGAGCSWIKVRRAAPAERVP